MKVCPICQSTYDDGVDFCFKEGAPLEQQASADAPSEVVRPDPTGLTIEDLEPPDAVSLSGLIPIATEVDDLKTLPLTGQMAPVLEEDELATVTSGVQQVEASEEEDTSGVGDPFEEPEAAGFRARVTGAHSSTQLGPDLSDEDLPDTHDRMETVQWDGPPSGAPGANDGSSGFLKLVVGLCVLVVLIIGYQMQGNSPVEDDSSAVSEGAAVDEPEDAVAAADTSEPPPNSDNPTDAVAGQDLGEPSPVNVELDPEPDVETDPGDAAEGSDAALPTQEEPLPSDDPTSVDEVEEPPAESGEPEPEAAERELRAREERERAREEAREERLRKRAERLEEEKRRRLEAKSEAANDKVAAKEVEAPPSSGAGNPWTSSPSEAAGPAPTADAGNPWGVSAPATDTAKETPSLAKVTITTKPSGAKVKLAGKSRGSSPVKAELPVGTHEVQVTKEGFVSRSSYVKVKDASPVSVNIALEPLEAASAKREGTLFVSSSPAGAVLYVDGSSRGRTPLSVTVVEGTHSLKLVAEGKEPLTKRIKVDFTRTTTVRRFIEIP